jgi:hypothetical protein
MLAEPEGRKTHPRANEADPGAIETCLRGVEAGGGYSLELW